MLALPSFSQHEYAVFDGGCGRDTLFQSGAKSDTVYYCHSIQITVHGSCYDSLFWDWKYPDAFYFGDSALCWIHDTTLTNPVDSTWFFYETAFSGGTVKFHFIKKTPTSKICWVTVDSNFAHNVIIWDSTGFGAQNVDSIKIYYYITVTQRKLLATKPRNSATFYVDSVNNPNSGTFKYLITGVNGCGNEDTTSAWQTTAWIQQTGSTFTVSSPYTVEGNPTPVSYYILYRDTIGTGHYWDSIFETPGTVLNDPNYANYPNAKYYVAAVLNMPGCTTPAIVNRMESLPANKSRSNRLKNNVTGINEVSNLSFFKVYPNPFISNFSLDLLKESEVRIYDALGRMVYQSRMQIGHNLVALNGQSKGIYFLVVNGVATMLVQE